MYSLMHFAIDYANHYASRDTMKPTKCLHSQAPVGHRRMKLRKRPTEPDILSRQGLA